MADLLLLGAQRERVVCVVIEPDATPDRPGFTCARCGRWIPYVVMAGTRRRIYQPADLPVPGTVYCFRCSAAVREEGR